MQSGIKANPCLETRTDWHDLRATPRWCPINYSRYQHHKIEKKIRNESATKERSLGIRSTREYDGARQERPTQSIQHTPTAKHYLGHSESNQALTLLLLFFLLKNI